MTSQSFALSFAGNLYYWGDIGPRKDSIYFPIRLNSSIKIQSILYTTSDANFDLCVLSSEGIIYKLSEGNKEIVLKIFCDLNEEMKGGKLIDYTFFNNVVMFQTEDCVSVYNNSKVEKTSYKTLFEYFLFEFQITFKTIHIKENQLFVLDFENNEESLFEKQKRIYSIENSLKQNDTNLSLRNFRISNDLPQILGSNVKYYYQSESNSADSYFGLFVMNDNRVYSFGDNKYGKLGLGHSDRVYEYTEIIELKEKNIQQFYEGEECMFARNNENNIFSWGRNFYGQLARGYKSEGYLRPEKMDFFDGKNIIEISCGSSHCLALSYDGRVYGWGRNNFGQIRCGERETYYISTPIEIDFNEKVQFIHCAKDFSFGVCFNGISYYWGKIDIIDKIFIPTSIPMKSVFKIYYYSRQMCIILDKNGKLFKFYYQNEEIIEIQSEVNFYDLYCDLYCERNLLNEDNYCLLQSEECIYELTERKLYKTDIINFFDFYSNKLQYYKKTIEISKDGYLMEKQIHFNEREKNLGLRDKYVFERKYQNNYEEIIEKGSGGFGTVYEVEKKSNKVHYAIKMIEIKSDLNLNEIKIMSELNNDFVVQYIDSWIEGQMIFRKIKRYFFIQMELCSNNVKDFIELMNDTLNEKFLPFYYFISCELFKELIECVNYLHSLNPPIIHRDLKQENILISKGINGRFLKLCDFGLAKIHQKSNHTRMAGTWNYMAPEVRDSENYNIKSDIYSLALIATEIFRFEDKVKNIRKHKNREDFDKYLCKYLNSIFENPFKKLLKTLSKCLLQEDHHLRPDCKQLLECIKEVTIDNNIILNDEKLIEFESSLNKPENLILRMFFDTKIMQTFDGQNYFTFNYSDSQDQYIIKTLSTLKKYIKCSAICSKALTYITNLFKDKLNLNETLMEKIVENSLLVMQTHPNNQNLQRNALSIISNEYILEKVTFNWFLCAKMVVDCFVKYNERDINHMFLVIFNSIKSKLSEIELSCINQNVVYIETLMSYIISYIEEEQSLNENLVEKMIEETLLVMQTHPNNQNLQSSALSLISKEYILENVAFNWFFCAKMVLDCFVKFSEIHIDYMALLIFYRIKSKLSENELNCINRNVVYIEALIEIIKKRNNLFIDINKIDHLVMYYTLSALCNLTDEAHETSILIISKGGFDLWLNILNEFEGYPILMKLILIVLNNMAEVTSLRTQLMRDEFLLTLRELIKSPDNYISLYSSGILANLCCDQQNWIYSSLELSDILNDLEKVILKWQPIEQELGSYKSLISFIPLLSCFESPVIQLWAMWTLYYHFSKNPKRYYDMLVNIDGITIVKFMFETCNENSELQGQLKKYCKHTLDIIRDYKSENPSENI